MERRRYPRVSVGDDVFIALSNGSNRIGRVRDLSPGGLSFEHIYEAITDSGNLGKDLLLWFNDIRLPKMTCKIVYDIPLPNRPEYGLLIIQLMTRRCGVQFESLTEEQAEQLSSFLSLFLQK